MARIFFIVLILAGLATAFPILFERFGSPTQTVEQAATPTPSATSSQNPSAYSGRRAQIAPDSRGHFITDIRFNGQNLRAMIDTGASSVAINTSTARRIGISLRPDDFRYRVSTANGETSAARAVLSSVEIGRIRVENVEAIVLRDEALSDILLGMTFLKRLRHYEVANGALILTQ
jgi:aspartyl protease family protein